MFGEINFVDEDGQELEVYVIEETRINGVDYLLVTDEDNDDEEGEVEGYILKDVSPEDSEEAEFIVVEDEEELEYVSKIFNEILEDLDIEK